MTLANVIITIIYYYEKHKNTIAIIYATITLTIKNINNKAANNISKNDANKFFCLNDNGDNDNTVFTTNNSIIVVIISKYLLLCIDIFIIAILFCTITIMTEISRMRNGIHGDSDLDSCRVKIDGIFGASHVSCSLNRWSKCARLQHSRETMAVQVTFDAVSH